MSKPSLEDARKTIEALFEVGTGFSGPVFTVLDGLTELMDQGTDVEGLEKVCEEIIQWVENFRRYLAGTATSEDLIAAAEAVK